MRPPPVFAGSASSSCLAATAARSWAALVLCCGSVFVAADMRAALAEAEAALFPETDWVFEHKGEPHLLM